MNDSPAAQPLDHNLFRKALSRFPTGVGVATTVSASGQPRGMTISSFNSVSMTPPLILWSIGLEAACFEDFKTADKFAVNILSATPGRSQPNIRSCAGMTDLPPSTGLYLHLACRLSTARQRFLNVRSGPAIQVVTMTSLLARYVISPIMTKHLFFMVWDG